MLYLRIFKKILTFFTIIWFAGLTYFISQIPVKNPETLFKADAIVVLTGGKKRVEAGIDLLSKKTAQLMLISGVGKHTSLKHLKAKLNVENLSNLNFNNDAITLGRLATSTHENALETAEWVKEKKVDSIILITSNYHMPRSLIEFKKELPDIKIYSYSVFSNNFNKEHWYENLGSFKIMILEYIKYTLKVLKG